MVILIMKKIKQGFKTLVGKQFTCLQCNCELEIESEKDYHIYYGDTLQWKAPCPICGYHNRFSVATGEQLK